MQITPTPHLEIGNPTLAQIAQSPIKTAHYTIGQQLEDGTIVVRAALNLAYREIEPREKAEQVLALLERWDWGNEELKLFDRQDGPEFVESEEDMVNCPQCGGSFIKDEHQLSRFCSMICALNFDGRKKQPTPAEQYLADFKSKYRDLLKVESKVYGREYQLVIKTDLMPERFYYQIVAERDHQLVVVADDHINCDYNPSIDDNWEVDKQTIYEFENCQ